MQLLYPYEHISCSNYDDGEGSLIEVRDIVEGKENVFSTQVNTIVFVTKGGLKLCYGSFKDKEMAAGHFMLFPAGSKITLRAEQSTTINIFRLYFQAYLCDKYSLEKLFKEGDAKEVEEQGSLKTNPILDTYLDMLSTCISDGFKCACFFELKIKELFYLLRAYHTKKELLQLFYPMLSRDTGFSNHILRNYKKARTVKDLAEMSNYSVSGFEKRFKRVFDVSPRQWLKQQRAKSIYYEINSSTKSLKEISIENGFTSPAHLNEFCRSQFGETPGNIRKQNKSVE